MASWSEWKKFSKGALDKYTADVGASGEGDKTYTFSITDIDGYQNLTTANMITGATTCLANNGNYAGLANLRILSYDASAGKVTVGWYSYNSATSLFLGVVG